MFIFISRGNQACARIANAKRTTQSRDAALSAIYIEGTCLTFELVRSPWQPVRFFENNSEIHDICWGIMNKYFLILWILPSGFGWNWCQNWRFILSTMCANDRNFRVSTRPLRPFLVLFVTTFEQKHRFLRVHFEVVIPIFWDDLDYLLCNAGVSFWFYPDRDPFFLGGVFSFFPNFDLKSRIWPVICLSQVWNLKFQRFLWIFSKIGQNSKKWKNPS